LWLLTMMSTEMPSDATKTLAATVRDARAVPAVSTQA
jgi:hypothetical protein